MDCDVAIIGGGPAGSTVGSILKTHDPSLNVVIFEREVFPRDHVGESQLPGINAVLNEIGVWDKIEAANFPIKLGATYRWGKTKELWDFQFFPKENFVDEERPSKFEGQRTATAFQVDRAIYDDILLRHSEELGCTVCEGVGVTSVVCDGDTVTELKLSNGETVHAKTYIDASGHSGLLRRSLGIETDVATTLQNVAFWDYWQNAEWATEIGVGGTFVQVMSLGYGWIWFIPLGPTRTSVGLIVPAAYYKESKKSPKELYAEAIQQDDRISHLLRNAVSEDKFATTKDWSFISKRHVGENWFLVGEAGGFADPILAAGLTIAHLGAREAAYTILELNRGRLPKKWLLEQYDNRQMRRITNHIRFADFWYTSNGQFTDLQDFTAELARDSGLDLDPQKAWQWIAQGGFIDEDLTFGSGGYQLDTLKSLPKFLQDFEISPIFEDKNVLRLRVDDADVVTRCFYSRGRIERIEGYERDGKLLPLRWIIPIMINFIRTEGRLPQILAMLDELKVKGSSDLAVQSNFLATAVRALESMVRDGWLETEYDASVPLVTFSESSGGLHWSDDVTLGVSR